LIFLPFFVVGVDGNTGNMMLYNITVQ
jgi:hypothetical protein